MKKQQLAYIIGNLNNGGQERQLFYLLKELKKLNRFNITVFVWSFDASQRYYEPIKKLGVVVVGFNNNSNFLVKTIKIRKYINKNNFLVLQSYTFYLNFICWLSTQLTKTKPIGGLRSSIYSEYEESKLQTYINALLPKRLISNNYASKAEMKRMVGLRRKKMFVLHNKIDKSNFNIKKKKINKPIVTCSIGRIDQFKRINMIIDLVDRLKKDGYTVLHKHAGEGILKEDLENEIKKRELINEFEFSGKVLDINTFLNESSIFIHTSATEGMPNVILEAMAKGKAIISTNCGDVSYLVRDNENGFIIPIDDLEALVFKTKFLLDNRNLRQNMGNKSSEIIGEKFDISYMVKELFELYREFRIF